MYNHLLAINITVVSKKLYLFVEERLFYEVVFRQSFVFVTVAHSPCIDLRTGLIWIDLQFYALIHNHFNSWYTFHSLLWIVSTFAFTTFSNDSHFKFFFLLFDEFLITQKKFIFHVQNNTQSRSSGKTK